MMIQFECNPSTAASDHLKPLSDRARAARKKRRQLRRAAWREFIESVFSGAPRHPDIAAPGRHPAE